LQGQDQELIAKLIAHPKATGAELIKLIDLSICLFRQDGARLSDFSNKVTDAFLEIASSEAVWSTFDVEVMVPVYEDFRDLIEKLRKRYCTLYSSLINR